MRRFWQSFVFLVRDHILTLTLALIDSGAEQSFIDQTRAEELGLLLITLAQALFSPVSKLSRCSFSVLSAISGSAPLQLLPLAFFAFPGSPFF